MKHDMPMSVALDELSRRDVAAHRERGAIIASLSGETIATTNRLGDVSSRAVFEFIGC